MTAETGSDALSLSYDDVSKSIRVGDAGSVEGGLISGVDPATYDKIVITSDVLTRTYSFTLAAAPVIAYKFTYSDGSKGSLTTVDLI